MKPLVLIGAGGHCRSCIDVVIAEGKFYPVGLVMKSNLEVANIDLPVLGSDDELHEIIKLYSNVLISVGQIQSASARKRLFSKIKSYGANLPVIMSPSAYCAENASVGEGSILMHGTIVSTNSVIGSNCIINSRALVEHDAKVGDHCHVSTGAILNGGVMVGAGAFIGSGSVIKEGVRIGENAVIGAGNIVLKDINSNCLVRART